MKFWQGTPSNEDLLNNMYNSVPSIRGDYAALLDCWALKKQSLADLYHCVDNVNKYSTAQFANSVTDGQNAYYVDLLTTKLNHRTRIFANPTTEQGKSFKFSANRSSSRLSIFDFHTVTHTGKRILLYALLRLEK